MRWCLLAIVAVGVGCWDQPGPHVANQDCVACHRPDYEATTMPPHVGVFPETCGECHTNDAWIPATGGAHPEESFPIAMGSHADIACTDCHDVARGPNGAENTTCVGCHTGAHSRAPTDELHIMRAVAGYPSGDAEPNFCLVCHPDGTANVTSHPEANFPIAMGPHQPVICNECHNAALGVNGAGNTDCINCHTGEHRRSAADPIHSAVDGYPGPEAPVNFCLVCHPDGTASSAQHPEGEFPIANGAHSEMECADCHNADLGSAIAGMNADCVGCHDGGHTRGAMDPKHRDVSEYPSGSAPPNFCLDCHPAGRN